MFRTVRTIAAATITVWGAAAAAADSTPTGGPAGQGQVLGQGQVPGQGETPAAVAPPPAAPMPSPAQAAPQAPPPAPPQASSPPAPPPQAPAQVPSGTPATVLDTQDYEGILGKGVRNAAGEDMGRIIDIILDKDGRPRAAIIDFGGFLGVGSRKIAVDWRALRFNQEGKAARPVLQLSRNQVRVSPEYKPGDPIVVLGPASPSVPTDGDQAAAPPAIPAAAPAPAPAPPAPAAAPSAPAPDKPPEKNPDR